MGDIFAMMIGGWKLIIGITLFGFSVIVVFGILNRIVRWINERKRLY